MSNNIILIPTCMYYLYMCVFLIGTYNTIDLLLFSSLQEKHLHVRLCIVCIISGGCTALSPDFLLLFSLHQNKQEAWWIRVFFNTSFIASYSSCSFFKKKNSGRFLASDGCISSCQFLSSCGSNGQFFQLTWLIIVPS